MALGFSVIETSQYARTGRGCFTSVDQFFANVVYCSLVIDKWQSMAISVWLRVLLGPLTIWLLEVVQNYALLLAFGRNTAWCYTGTDYGCCHGAIDLAMLHLWRVLSFSLPPSLPPSLSFSLCLSLSLSNTHTHGRRKNTLALVPGGC